MSNDVERMTEALEHLHAAERTAATREAELNAAAALIAGFRATVAEQRAEIERLQKALDTATDDDVLASIVQDALADLGVLTRLDNGKSMRGFCNAVSSQIINELRVHYTAARRPADATD